MPLRVSSLQVLVVEVKDGDVASMAMDAEGFKAHALVEDKLTKDNCAWH